MPSLSLVCSARLIRALSAQGRAGEAAAVARESLAELLKLQGTGFSEIPLRAAVAEALFEVGEREEAARVLRDARRQIELRASKIPDLEGRDRYVNGNAEHGRVFELARAWGALQELSPIFSN
jgi:hypothetical protein